MSSDTDHESLDDLSEPGVATTDVVAISPVVRRVVLVFLVVVGTFLAGTLIWSVIDGDEEVVADDPSLLITTTTVPASTSTSLPDQSTTTTELVATAELVEPIVAFADFPTNTKLVLWTFNESRIIVVDIDGGVASEVDLNDLGVPLVERIIAAGDRLVVQSLGDYYAVDLDGDRSLLNTRGVVQAFGDDEVWVTDAFVGEDPLVPFRINFDGERVELPQIPAGASPFGWYGDQLLVGAGGVGGVYISTDERYSYLVPGELLASGNGFLLTRICNAVLECTIARHNLMTGDRTNHEIPPGFSLTALWWLDEPNSPTFDAVLGVSSELGAPAIWDLVTDEVTPLAIAQGRGATFSVDGSWVFVSVGNEVVGYHRETGIEVVVAISSELDSPNGVQLAALPAE